MRFRSFFKERILLLCCPSVTHHSSLNLKQKNESLEVERMLGQTRNVSRGIVPTVTSDSPFKLARSSVCHSEVGEENLFL